MKDVTIIIILFIGANFVSKMVTKMATKPMIECDNTVYVTDTVYIRDTVFVEKRTVKSIGKEKLTNYEVARYFLKSMEALNYISYPDHKQMTWGWGTEAPLKYPSKKDTLIGLYQANEEINDYFQEIYNEIRRSYPMLNNWESQMISVFAYNTPIGKGLHDCLIKHDMKGAANMMLKYFNASGVRNKGLVLRRKREVELLFASPRKKQELGLMYKGICIEKQRNAIHNLKSKISKSRYSNFMENILYKKKP